MTVTTNEYGQNNLFAKEPQMVVEDYNRKGLFSPMQQREMYNGRWAMMGVVSGFLSYAITGKLFFGICLLYTSPSPRDRTRSRMPSSA